MCRRVIWRRVDRRPELRNGAVEIPGVKKPPPRICREERRLLARLLFRDIRSRFAFGRGTFGVSKLAEHGCQSRMSAREVRLQTDSFSQSRRGILQLALLFQDRSQRVIRLGIIRLRANRRAE